METAGSFLSVVMGGSLPAKRGLLGRTEALLLVTGGLADQLDYIRPIIIKCVTLLFHQYKLKFL